MRVLCLTAGRSSGHHRACRPLVGGLRVQRRRRQIGVVEQFLDQPNIGAALQQVRDERVPEPVRMAFHHAGLPPHCLTRLATIFRVQGLPFF